MDFLDYTFFNNSISDWLKTLAIAIVFFAVLHFVKSILLGKFSSVVRKTKNNLDDALLKIIGQTKDVFILFLGILCGIRVLNLPENWLAIINKIFFIAAALQVGAWLVGLINHLTSYQAKGKKEDKREKTTIYAFGLFGKIIIWIIISLVILQNATGMKVDALITSLGIGGIAIGLAVQNILKDIFASLSIFLDKPFLVGDYITVGEIGGTVENIGLKSTRLKTLLGDEVIFSNSDLLESQIHNYRKMERRMVVINIGVASDTPYKTLKSLPALFEEIITKQENASFDRANLSEIGEYTLNFEVVFHIESADFTLYMNTKEAVFLEIIRRLQEKDVVMPYPTRAVILNK